MEDSNEYITNQINGQIVYELNDKHNIICPDDSEVFICRLPRDFEIESLVNLMQSTGTIYKLRLMINFSGTNRGFAFVRYTSVQAAKLAVSILNGIEIRPNRFLKIVKSVDNKKLFITRIPKNCSITEMKDILKLTTEGIENIKTSMYKKSKSVAETSKTNVHLYFIVKYESHYFAAQARRKLLHHNFSVKGHKIQVEWAFPDNQSNKVSISCV